MSEFSPIKAVMDKLLGEELSEHSEKQALKIELLPLMRPLDDVRTPDRDNDPSELIASRFLYRGGVCLLLGPTGVGKSSFLMQLSIHLALGKPFFGIEPGKLYRNKGMRVALLQAENDDGDLAEMRDGVLAGCKLTDAEKVESQRRIMVATIADRSGEKFALTLDALLVEHGPFDLVLVDPAFAYLGGDSNSQRDVSRFMRELLNPLLQRHQVGMILAHHTNKPLRGKEKDNWEAGDFAYLGAGSAEWINPARAALAIRSIGSDMVFELRAPKRGRRLGWEDGDQQPTVVQYIAHHREPGIICWRLATDTELEELKAKKPGRPRSCRVSEVLHCILANEGRNQAYYMGVASAALACHASSVQRAITTATTKGWIRFDEEGVEHLYHLTDSGRKYAQERPSTIKWADSELKTPE